MKVLLVTTNYPPVPGGVSRYLKGLVDCSAGQIGVAGMDTGDPVPHSRHKVLDRFIQVLWSFRVARKTDPNIELLAGQLHLALGIWASGRRFSLILHGGEWEDHPFARGIFRKLMNGSKNILTSSHATAQEWVSITNQHKTMSLTPGLPDFGLRLLDRSSAVDLELERNSSFELLAVSRASPRKGIQKLVDAIQMCREQGLDVSTTVIGQDQGTIRTNDSIGGVRFLGHVSDNELADHYTQAQVFALVPERIKGGEGWEGFGIVYLEAAAAGLPIIATDTGGVQEAVTPEGSILLEANCTVTVLAKTIERLVADAKLRERMSEANQIWARSNEWNAKSLEVQSIIETIISTK